MYKFTLILIKISMKLIEQKNLQKGKIFEENHRKLLKLMKRQILKIKVNCINKPFNVINRINNNFEIIYHVFLSHLFIRSSKESSLIFLIIS